jgi:hypothetical protein
MNSKEFFDTVVEMRKLQKAYFRTRNHGILLQSKATEHKIDTEIERVNRIMNEEPTLFP